MTHRLSRRLSRIAPPLFFALAVACGGPSKDEVDVENAGKMATFIEAIAAATKAGGTDCGKIADGVEAVFREHKATLSSLDGWFAEADRDEARKVRIGELMYPRLAAVRPQLESIVACGDDPRMKAVEARLKALTAGR